MLDACATHALCVRAKCSPQFDSLCNRSTAQAHVTVRARCRGRGSARGICFIATSCGRLLPTAAALQGWDGGGVAAAARGFGATALAFLPPCCCRSFSLPDPLGLVPRTCRYRLPQLDC
eukprot:6183258-Pleurochrysis_carterae.AAC.1